MGKKVIHEGPHPGARASRPHSARHKEMSVDVSPYTAKSLRAGPTRERGRLARIRPGTRQCPWTSAHIQQKACERDPTRERGRLARIRPGTRQCPWTSAHIQQKACERDPTRERGRLARIRPGTRQCPWTSAHIQQKACERDPPGSAGVSPAFGLAQGNVRGRQPIHSNKLASGTHPGARASRPHSTWHKEMSVDVSPSTAISLRAGPTRERGRLARIRPGNFATNLAKVGSAHPARNRPLITGRNKVAGETPALPGGLRARRPRSRVAADG